MLGFPRLYGTGRSSRFIAPHLASFNSHHYFQYANLYVSFVNLNSVGPELNEFDRRDVDRVKQDDLCVWLFLRHKHKDVDKVMEMMVSRPV